MANKMTSPARELGVDIVRKFGEMVSRAPWGRGLDKSGKGLLQKGM